MAEPAFPIGDARARHGGGLLPGRRLAAAENQVQREDGRVRTAQQPAAENRRSGPDPAVRELAHRPRPLARAPDGCLIGWRDAPFRAPGGRAAALAES